LRGFDDIYFAPHSRHNDIYEEDLLKHPEVRLLSSSKEAGSFIMSANSGRQIIITGHLEYEAVTLAEKYFRGKS